MVPGHELTLVEFDEHAVRFPQAVVVLEAYSARHVGAINAFIQVLKHRSRGAALIVVASIHDIQLYKGSVLFVKVFL